MGYYAPTQQGTRRGRSNTNGKLSLATNPKTSRPNTQSVTEDDPTIATNPLSDGSTQSRDTSIGDAESKSEGTNLNILQVCKYYFPITGGMQTAIRSLVTGIDTVDFRVLTSRPSGVGNRDELDESAVIRAGSVGEFKSTPLSLSFPYYLKQQLSWADIVHYHLPFPVGPISHLLNRALQKPTVVTFHDEIVGKGPVTYPYKPVLNRFLDAANRIIVTSPNMRDKSSRVLDFESKTEIVPLGIETADMEFTTHSATDRTVLFVGRLVDFKGIDQLISSMKSIDATLSIVGKGPRRSALERHADDEGVSRKVTFEGFVSDERLDECYHDADVFVLPSTGENESFGIVQLEAMKHGLPVINTALPTGVPYVSVDGTTGITVPPGRPDEIAAAVSTLFADPELYQRFSKNAQQRVKNEFSRKQMLGKTEEIYRRVVAEDE
jgi:glycosyltransferase involved in cell wall biosynthesis